MTQSPFSPNTLCMFLKYLSYLLMAGHVVSVISSMKHSILFSKFQYMLVDEYGNVEKSNSMVNMLGGQGEFSCDDPICLREQGLFDPCGLC